MDAFLKSFLDLKYYTTMHIGGIVEWAFFPVDRKALPEIFSIIQEKLKVPFFVLGRGSNIVLKEGNLKIAAILTHRLDQYYIEDETLLIADAGIPMSFLAKESLLKHHLSGLDFLYGLPGSMGGGAFMNARVFSADFNSVVEWVEVFDYKKHQFKIISNKECDYSYKHSIFQDKPYFITRVAVRLNKAKNIEECWEKTKIFRQMRVDKQHFAYPSAGSFFKNNYSLGQPSGAILDELHLKGFEHKGAKISEYHANFFINPGYASFDDMKELRDIVNKKLKAEKGITLEPEVRFIDESSLEY